MFYIRIISFLLAAVFLKQLLLWQKPDRHHVSVPFWTEEELGGRVCTQMIRVGALGRLSTNTAAQLLFSPKWHPKRGNAVFHDSAGNHREQLPARRPSRCNCKPNVNGPTYPCRHHISTFGVPLWTEGESGSRVCMDCQNARAP